MKTKHLFSKEVQISLIWHLTWIICLSIVLILTEIIYLGNKKESDLLNLLNKNYLQILFGKVPKSTQGLTLWLSIILPFIVMIIFLYSVMSGVRAAVQSISDGTGEILHTLPITRKKFLLTRFLASLVSFATLFFLQLVIFFIPLINEPLILDRLIIISFWGFIFCIFGLSIGIIIGLLSGNSTKGYQISVLFLLFIYIIQVISRIDSTFNFLTNFNPLTYYQPGVYLVFQSFSLNYFTFNILNSSINLTPFLLIGYSVILLAIGFLWFDRKDLIYINQIGFHLPNKFALLKFNTTNIKEQRINKILISPLSSILTLLGKIKTKIYSLISPTKKRTNPLVFWARLFEERMPITADYIYSESNILFISVLTIILFFPIQIGFYPGNKKISSSITSLYSSGIFLVFSYGHLLPSYPYLWYFVVNSIGRIWILFIPLSFIWVRKAINFDNNSKTGEILGSLPIKPKTVVYQRTVAIFSELLFLLIITSFSVIIAEKFTNNTYNNFWEVFSIFSLFLFYAPIIIIESSIFLYFRKRGNLLSGLFLISMILSFIINILDRNLKIWLVGGIFDLYDPVLIMREQSIFSNNFSLVILTVILFLSLLLLNLLGSRFLFLKIEKNQKTKLN